MPSSPKPKGICSRVPGSFAERRSSGARARLLARHDMRDYVELSDVTGAPSTRPECPFRSLPVDARVPSRKRPIDGYLLAVAQQIGQAIDELMAWPLRVIGVRGCSPPRGDCVKTFADGVCVALRPPRRCGALR